jgi:hypothetical protein
MTLNIKSSRTEKPSTTKAVGSSSYTVAYLVQVAEERRHCVLAGTGEQQNSPSRSVCAYMTNACSVMEPEPGRGSRGPTMGSALAAPTCGT